MLSYSRRIKPIFRKLQVAATQEHGGMPTFRGEKGGKNITPKIAPRGARRGGGKPLS